MDRDSYEVLKKIEEHQERIARALEEIVRILELSQIGMGQDSGPLQN